MLYFRHKIRERRDIVTKNKKGDRNGSKEKNSIK